MRFLRVLRQRGQASTGPNRTGQLIYSALVVPEGRLN